MSSPTRHAEIAGGGLAGLTTATALAQRGWSVRLHERGRELREIGAGIFMWENALRVLEEIGAFDEAVHRAERIDSHAAAVILQAAIDRLAGGAF